MKIVTLFTTLMSPKKLKNNIVLDPIDFLLYKNCESIMKKIFVFHKSKKAIQI